MNFMQGLKNEMNNQMKLTENGAVGYVTTGKALLDLNFSVTALRRKSDNEIESEFVKAFYENKMIAMKWLFYLRDREGIGERRTFRVIMKYLAKNHSDIAKAVLELIPEYGRFDDLWCLLDTELRSDVITIVKTQLNKDAKNIMENKPISLLAKWLPSLNASSKETKRLAKIIRDDIGFTDRQYRKTLSKLRNYLNVVEVKMSAKQWGDINYSAVPSRANLIYNNAFLRNDEERRREYLSALERGYKGVKINASVLFPDEIVHKYGRGYCLKSKDTALEEMWKALPNLGSTGNTLTVRDGSGSMEWYNGGKALDVSTALAIYMAERCEGQFTNKFITFSRTPKLIDLTRYDTLRDKLLRTYKEDDCSNTDIEAVFELILDVAVKNNLFQEEMPKNIVIVSDMAFDASRHNFSKTLFGSIQKMYEAKGYKIPRLIFWNVNECATNAIPVRSNEFGVVLMSGYSANLMNMIMNGEVDPYKCLLVELNKERYQAVEDAVKDIV